MTAAQAQLICTLLKAISDAMGILDVSYSSWDSKFDYDRAQRALVVLRDALRE